MHAWKRRQWKSRRAEKRSGERSAQRSVVLSATRVRTQLTAELRRARWAVCRSCYQLLVCVRLDASRGGLALKSRKEQDGRARQLAKVIVEVDALLLLLRVEPSLHAATSPQNLKVMSIELKKSTRRSSPDTRPAIYACAETMLCACCSSSDDDQLPSVPGPDRIPTRSNWGCSKCRE